MIVCVARGEELGGREVPYGSGLTNDQWQLIRERWIQLLPSAANWSRWVEGAIVGVSCLWCAPSTWDISITRSILKFKIKREISSLNNTLFEGERVLFWEDNDLSEGQSPNPQFSLAAGMTSPSVVSPTLSYTINPMRPSSEGLHSHNSTPLTQPPEERVVSSDNANTESESNYHCLCLRNRDAEWEEAVWPRGYLMIDTLNIPLPKTGSQAPAERLSTTLWDWGAATSPPIDVDRQSSSPFILQIPVSSDVEESSPLLLQSSPTNSKYQSVDESQVFHSKAPPIRIDQKLEMNDRSYARSLSQDFYSPSSSPSTPWNDLPDTTSAEGKESYQSSFQSRQFIPKIGAVPRVDLTEEAKWEG